MASDNVLSPERGVPDQHRQDALDFTVTRREVFRAVEVRQEKGGRRTVTRIDQRRWDRFCQPIRSATAAAHRVPPARTGSAAAFRRRPAASFRSRPMRSATACFSSFWDFVMFVDHVCIIASRSNAV